MIRDTALGAPALQGSYDCCIVGAGPAGISMALRMAKAGLRIALLEGGGRDFTPESQSLYEGEVAGDYYPLDAPRLRYLGGTTGHWGGRLFLLDEHDFEPREDVPLSGWPIRAADLAPYRGAVAAMLGTSDFGGVRRAADDTGWIDILDQRWSVDRPFHDIRSTEPVRFGKVFADQLAQEASIDLVLNANVTGFDIDGATGRVTGVAFQDLAEGRYTVAADIVVMAMGGIENARMLLDLNDRQDNRFGNQGDMVGRCFMEHTVIRNGAYFVTRRLYSHSPTWEIERLRRRAIPELALSPSASFARETGVLNATLQLGRLRRQELRPEDANAAPMIEGMTFGRDYFFTGTTEAVAEQAPHRDSRITLSDQRDRLGLRKVALDLRLDERDFETLRSATVEAGRYLMRTGLGRMKVEPALWNRDWDLLPLDYSSHHMGGARMSATPQTGVVDSDCKVHGAPNLYVAGSGVFATGGHANPTFSILQLALRLSDHLTAQFGPRG